MQPIVRFMLLPLFVSLAIVYTSDAGAEEPVQPPKAAEKDKPAPAPEKSTAANPSGDAKPIPPSPTPPKPAGSSLMDLDIESLSQVSVSLAQVKVVSVSKKVEKLSDAPAAIYSISQEELRRNGAQSIPEALRGVPGLSVARIDSGGYAIGSRGLASRFTSNLLVLNDGRSIYQPLFAGTFWEQQNIIMENINRIEVIRGPGATLYGSNAVNGVINIITKSSKDTQGWLASGYAGNQDNNGAVQYGGQIGEHAWFRVFGQYTDRDDNVKPVQDVRSGDPAGDTFRNVLGGARFDWEPTPDDRVTIQGDYQSLRYSENFLLPGNLPDITTASSEDKDRQYYALARWSHRLSETSGFSMQMFYDHPQEDLAIGINEKRDTMDFEFQYQFAAGKRNAFVIGLGERFTNDSVTTEDDSIVTFTSSSDPNNILSGFIQDEITILEDKLKLTVGTKVENNDYSGFEIQPSARLAWTPTSQHTVWSSVSRAARTPSQVERTVGIVGALVPNQGFETTYVNAYELGYRFVPSERFSLDIAGFINDYHQLSTRDPIDDTGVVTFANSGYGRTLGAEVSATWHVVKPWRLTASYTGLSEDLHPQPLERDEGLVPKHQFQVHSYLDLPHNIELDMGLYFIDKLPSLSVPSYVRFDAAVGWKPTKHFEFRLVGQNLNRDVHTEYGFDPAGIFNAPTQIERSVFLKAVLRF